MTDKAISALSSTAALANGDELVLNQDAGGGAFSTKRIAISAFKTALGFITSGGALGTPSSGTLTNCTGLPPGGGGKPTNRFIDYGNGLSPNMTSTPVWTSGSNQTKMSGLGSSSYGHAWTITPSSTGRVRIKACLNMQGDAGNGRTDLQFAYGTGTAPAVNAASAGTLLGRPTSNTWKSNALGAAWDSFIPIAMESEVSGLSVGTAYWFDLFYQTWVFDSGQVYPSFSYVCIEEF